MFHILKLRSLLLAPPLSTAPVGRACARAQNDGVRTRPPRNQAIEALRILSAFGVAAYHARTPALGNVFYAGLIVFLMLSPMMDLLFNWDRVRSKRSLAVMLLVPWAFWSIVYGLRNIAAHKPILPGSSLIGDAMIGTSVHLWFLPFIFVVLVALNGLKPWCRPSVLFWCSAILGGALFASESVWRPLSLNWPLPLPQWMHAAPVIFCSIMIGLTPRTGVAAIVGGLLVITVGAITIAALLPTVSITYLLGICATVIVVFTSDKWFPKTWSVQPVANCVLGVYLVHLLPLSTVSRFAGHGTYLTAVIVFVISLACVAAARRFVPLSKFILG